MELLVRLVDALAESTALLVDILPILPLFLLLLHLIQLVEHCVGHGTGFCEDFPRLFSRTVQQFGPLGLQPLPMLLGSGGVLLHLQPQTGGLPLLRLHLLALALHLAQHVLKLDVLPIQMPACQLDDVLRQTQPPGDGEGVGLAGDADEEAIGGTEGLHVELTGGVLHPGGGHGVQLQFGVVGGGHDLGAQAPGLLDDGSCQRRTLHWVGAGAQLVEEQ